MPQGCHSKFLNALLGASRIEMFMPGVEILSEGDHVNELHIVVTGSVKVRLAAWLGWADKFKAADSCMW